MLSEAYILELMAQLETSSGGGDVLRSQVAKLEVEGRNKREQLMAAQAEFARLTDTLAGLMN